MSRIERLLLPVGALVATREIFYNLLAAIMLIWWLVSGFGASFGATRIPWWSLLPAAASVAASIWLHRLLRRGYTRGFLVGMLATEIMLWTAVATIGFRGAFLLWGLAQIGAVVLMVPVVWVEVQVRCAQGYLDDELLRMGADYAAVFAVGFAAIALFVGAVTLK
jgi:hypothetical protein